MKQTFKYLSHAALVLAATMAGAIAAPPKYAPDVPAKITTPDAVETRIGTFHFKDGMPDPATAQLAYDQLDYTRGVDAFLTGMSATSIYAVCQGFDEVGIKPNHGIGISEDLLDARSLFLTANTTTVYAMGCMNLNEGPVVVRVPPRILGPVDDADFRWVTDVGFTGPDKGRAAIICSFRPATRERCRSRAITSRSRHQPDPGVLSRFR